MIDLLHTTVQKSTLFHSTLTHLMKVFNNLFLIYFTTGSVDEIYIYKVSL